MLRTGAPYSGATVSTYSAPMGYPVPPPTLPPSGGDTLPPTAAYFPVTTYSNNNVDNTQQVMMSQDSLNQPAQPNTPDLLMHRRQVRDKSGFFTRPNG